MRFKKLKLYTHLLESEFKFYVETLGFHLIKSNPRSFSVQAGWTELTFERSETVHQYHYCFLIPSNKLREALHWMEEKTAIIEIEAGQKTQIFESWNAESFYFCDASGNIAEFIVRYDLENEEDDDFDISKVRCVNEIGLPTDDIRTMSDLLETELGAKPWKGDLETFGTSGSQEGMFLLPNYTVKNKWFPTSIEIKPEPFEVVIESNQKIHDLDFRDGVIAIKPTFS